MRTTTPFVLALAAATTAAHGGIPEPPPHLASLFSSVARDVENCSAPVVFGTVPAWLSVTKYNNGFGMFEGGSPADPKSQFAFKYLFDVMPYIVKWRIEAGAVSFSNKMIQSEYFEAAKTAIPHFRTFGGFVPPMTALQKAETLANVVMSDSFNVNVQQFGSHLLALSDMAGAMEIDADTLATRGLYAYNDTLSASLSMITCAHPSQLPGEKYAYNYLVSVMGDMPHVGAVNKFVFFRLDTSAEPLRRELLLEIPIPNGRTPYMHQFAHTPSYLVLVQYPLHWSIPRIIASSTSLPAMEWEPANGTQVVVVDKASGTIVKTLWYKDGIFAYHHINAFEDDAGDIIMDISLVPCGGSTGAAQCQHMNAFSMDTIKNNSFAVPANTITRFTVPVATDSAVITAKVVTNTSFDLIAFNGAYMGRKYRFAYGTGDHGEGVWWNNLVKVDMETGATTEWYKRDHFPSEPNFIARPGATAEDDGVLLSVVLGGDRNASYLLVLDAATMLPLAEADAPHFLPYLSHGFAAADSADSFIR